MGTDNRQLLRKQLEYQAKLLETSKNNTELVLSTLSTCVSLLQVVESSMPKTISQSEFDSIFAGYLGITGRVDGFHKKNAEYFDLEKSNTLQTVLESLRRAETIKIELDEKIQNVENENSDVNSDIRNAEHLLKVEEEKYSSLIEKEKGLKKKLNGINKKIELLQFDLNKTTNDIKDLEPNIERLIKEVNTAKETYEEMVAYYSEYQRIQNGIKEEGYVDMESFHKKVDSMNDTGEQLMAEYDSLFKNLISDIENLQDKIDNRRKPGI